jgi:tetratricopeptide (TPR) repeat protein
MWFLGAMMTDPTTAISEIKKNLEQHLENKEWEAALGKLRALDLVGQSDPELERALLLTTDFMDALRAKNYAGAAKTSREGWKRLGVVEEGVEAALEALLEAEANWRNGANKVKTVLEKVLQHPMTKAEAENQLGVLEAVLENRDAARTHFQAALAADPRHYRAMTNLGNLELEAGHLSEAEARYREVVRLNPDYSVVYNNLAAVMRKQGKRSESVAFLKKSNQLSVREIRGDTKGTSIGRTRNPLADVLAKPNTKWFIAAAFLIAAYLIYQR